MPELMHIAEGELLAFVDRELTADRSAAVESHLAWCSQCRARSIDLQRSGTLYAVFHHEVLRPSLEPSSWPALRLERQRSKVSAWWMAAAAVCVIAGTVLFLTQTRSQQSRRMATLLNRAESVQPPAGEQIQIRMQGVTFLRPAVLTQDRFSANTENVRALFVRANYSWRDPLSARSFAEWRHRLRRKRDHVSTIQMESGTPAYVVRTDTTDSYLRSASVIIRRDDLESMRATLHFENEPTMEIDDAGQASPKMPAPRPSVSEPITADDELRVLAALDEIGADVNDAVTVNRDPLQNAVVVTGVGVRPSRQEEIRRKLATIPHAIVRFFSHSPQSTSHGESVSAEEPNADSKALLEARAGGAGQFDSVAAKATDASNALLARAHALNSIARLFPPSLEATLNSRDRSALLNLRRKHAAQIEHFATQLGGALAALWRSQGVDEADTQPPASWQSGAGRSTRKRAPLMMKSRGRLAGSIPRDKPTTC